MKKKIIIAVILGIIFTLLYIGVKDKENISINDLSKNIELITVHESYAANQKVTELAELATTPDATDLFYIIDGAVSKKIQYTTIAAAFGKLGDNDTISGTWDLGIPSAVVLTNATGIPLSALPYGTPYQLLQTNSGGTAAEYTSSPSFTEINLPSSDSAPSTTAGQIKHDSVITGLTDGGLRWYDGTTVRVLVDLDTDPADDDYVVSYDAAADKFYMKADAAGAETNSLETLTTGILENEIPIGKAGGDAVTYGTDLPTATTIGTAYVYRVGGTDVSDADVADNITVSNYLPLAGGTMSGDINLADNEANILLNDSPDDNTAHGTVINDTVGETVEQCDVMFLVSDGGWDLASNAVEGEASGMLGMATADGSGAANVLLTGICKNTTDLALATVGAKLYLGVDGSPTPTPTSTTGQFVRVIGYVIEADTIYFAPGPLWVEVP